jgi:predicted transcriptional regulator of viral defense system
MAWGLHPTWQGEHRVQFADEARTVIDILDDPKIGGGIRHVAEILEAFLVEFDWVRLVEYGDLLGNGAVFKRLGYLSERLHLGNEELTAACEERLSGGISLLDSSAPARGPRVGRWGLRANALVDESGAS